MKMVDSYREGDLRKDVQAESMQARRVPTLNLNWIDKARPALASPRVCSTHYLCIIQPALVVLLIARQRHQNVDLLLLASLSNVPLF